MDTSELSQVVGVAKRRRWLMQERRAIVEETLLPGSSVSRVARRHDVNANQVFYWRKLYREGRLGTDQALLPVKISAKEPELTGTLAGTIEIKVATGLIRISGEVDSTALRLALEYLLP